MGGVGPQVVDVIAPELHPDPACRDAARRHPRNLTKDGGRAPRPVGGAPPLGGARALGRGGAGARSRAWASSWARRSGVARALGVLHERQSAGGPTARSAYATQKARDGARANAVLEASRRRRAEAEAGAEAGAAPGGRQLAERHYEGRDLGRHAAQAGVVRTATCTAAPPPARRAPAARPAGHARHQPPPPRRASARRLAREQHDRDARRAQLAARPARAHDAAAHGAARAPGRGGLAREPLGTAVASLGALRARATAARDAASAGAGAGRGGRDHRRWHGARSARSPSATRGPARHLRLPGGAARRAASRPSRSRSRSASSSCPRHTRSAGSTRVRSGRTRFPFFSPEAVSTPLPFFEQELVGNWDVVFDESARLRDVVVRRLEARRAGVAHAEAVRRHPTGVEWLDSARHARPSALGEAMRRLWHRVAHDGADPPWHERTAGRRVARRLDDAQHGTLRRLGEAFLEGTVAAPFAFVDTVLPSGTVVRASRVGFWEATLRYVLSSTIGCYFVKPVEQRSDAQGDDGDAIKVLRPSAEKLCFPAARRLALDPHSIPTRVPPACTRTHRCRAPARSFHSSCPSCAPFARSPTPRTSTSRRSPTSGGVSRVPDRTPPPSRGARSLRRARRRTGTRDGVLQATAREIDALGYDARLRGPCCPTRPSCARPRGRRRAQRGGRAPRPSRPPRAPASSCAASRSSAACCTCSSCSSSRSRSSRSCPWSTLPSACSTPPPPARPRAPPAARAHGRPHGRPPRRRRRRAPRAHATARPASTSGAHRRVRRHRRRLGARPPAPGVGAAPPASGLGAEAIRVHLERPKGL